MTRARRPPRRVGPQNLEEDPQARHCRPLPLIIITHAMQDFTSQLLRAYFSSTDWHPHNSYLHLTSFSSSILLDFAIPSGLSVSISSTPSPIFYSTHRLRALPQLAGSLGYVFASTDKPLGFGHGRTNGVAQDDLRLRDVLERFRIVNVPSRPQGRVEVGPDGEAKAKRGECGAAVIGQKCACDTR